MKKTLSLPAWILVLAVLFAAPASSQAKELPKMITFTSYAVGSLGYIITSGLREAVEKITPMKVRVEPYGTDVARILPLKIGEGELCLATGPTGTCASYGIAEFGTEDWGPQPIRQVWRGLSLYVSCFARGDSGIVYPKDLRGKRVPKVPGWPTGTLSIEGVMAFGNLTWADVVPVPSSGYGEQVRGVMEGKVDVGWTATVVPAVKELGTSPYGVRWVLLPHGDREGWKRLQTKAPWIEPGLCKKGPGIPEEGNELGSYPYSVWTYAQVDEDVIYNVVKAMDKGYDIFKGMHKVMPAFNIKGAVTDPSPVPYHEGAVRFFKEAGVWTSDMDQWQREQLKAFEKRVSRFKK